VQSKDIDKNGFGEAPPLPSLYRLLRASAIFVTLFPESVVTTAIDKIVDGQIVVLIFILYLNICARGALLVVSLFVVGFQM